MAHDEAIILVMGINENAHPLAVEMVTDRHQRQGWVGDDKMVFYSNELPPSVTDLLWSPTG